MEDEIIDVDLSDMRDAISNMSSYYNENISNIKPGHKLYKNYNYINKISKNLFNIYNETKDISNTYESFISTLMNEFKPSEIKSNTVGSFLFGCFQDSYGDVDKSCSIVCNDGVQNPYHVKGSCKEQIIIQTKSKIKKYTSRFERLKSSPTDSHKAYIFLYSNFSGFTEHELDQLNDYGILMVEGLTTKYSQHHLVFKMRMIDDLPLMEDIPIKSYNNDIQKNMTVDDALQEVMQEGADKIFTYFKSDDFLNMLQYVFMFFAFAFIVIFSLGGKKKRGNAPAISYY